MGSRMSLGQPCPGPHRGKSTGSSYPQITYRNGRVEPRLALPRKSTRSNPSCGVIGRDWSGAGVGPDAYRRPDPTDQTEGDGVNAAISGIVGRM
jgi:hypothetical protein